MAASPMAKGAFGTVWAIQNGPSIPCSLKAYIGHPHELIFSKLSLPHHIVDVILEFGGAVNDYLLVVSTPSQYNFDVWAMWAHHLYDISEAFGIRAYNRRFLGSWNYMHLMSLLCVTGLGIRLCTPWIEAVVQRHPKCDGCLVAIRHHFDERIWWEMRQPCYFGQPFLSRLCCLVLPPLCDAPHAYRPYWQAAGPSIPIYSCHKSQDVMQTMLSMYVPPQQKESIQAVVKIAYVQPWRRGEWLPDSLHAYISMF